jgi:hypothetical protein
MANEYAQGLLAGSNVADQWMKNIYDEPAIRQTRLLQNQNLANINAENASKLQAQSQLAADELANRRAFAAEQGTPAISPATTMTMPTTPAQQSAIARLQAAPAPLKSSLLQSQPVEATPVAGLGQNLSLLQPAETTPSIAPALDQYQLQSVTTPGTPAKETTIADRNRAVLQAAAARGDQATVQAIQKQVMAQAKDMVNMSGDIESGIEYINSSTGTKIQSIKTPTIHWAVDPTTGQTSGVDMQVYTRAIGAGALPGDAAKQATFRLDAGSPEANVALIQAKDTDEIRAVGVKFNLPFKALEKPLSIATREEYRNQVIDHQNRQADLAERRADIREKRLIYMGNKPSLSAEQKGFSTWISKYDNLAKARATIEKGYDPITAAVIPQTQIATAKATINDQLNRTQRYIKETFPDDWAIYNGKEPLVVPPGYTYDAAKGYYVNPKAPPGRTAWRP